MDYKQKYEQAIEIIKKIKAANKENKSLVDFIEYKYPELKESEDERIRKELIECVKGIYKGCCTEEARKERNMYLAWLEKQGEQKSADKVEPKFKVGDWVVHCNEDVDLITGVEETGYIINKGSGYIPFVCEDDMRLWTIEDAKDGDVLTDGKPFIFKSINVNKHSYAYCGLSVDNAFIIESEGEYGEWTWIQDIKPATKEQRDLLFRKMKEAGYEWDSKKKELKLI